MLGTTTEGGAVEGTSPGDGVLGAKLGGIVPGTGATGGGTTGAVEGLIPGRRTKLPVFTHEGLREPGIRARSFGASGHARASLEW